MLNIPFLMILNNFLAFIVSLLFFLLIKPKVVIISVPPADQLLSTYILSKIIRNKLVIDYRDEFEDYLVMHTGKWAFFYRFLKRFLPYLYRNVTLVTPVRPAVAERLAKRGVHNVKVVYDGVDTTTFRPFDRSVMRTKLHLSKNCFVVAFLGNVYKPYRLDIVVNALKKLNKKNQKRKYLLILVGGGDIKSVLYMADKLDIRDSVKCVGVIKNPVEIAKILSSADCGIIPYDDDPLWQKTYSTKLFEYCAVGLPVIATVHENSVLASLIRKNNIGLIVRPLNSDALASSLEILSNNEESKIKMSLSALQFAQKYDKEKLARDLLKTIE